VLLINLNLMNKYDNRYLMLQETKLKEIINISISQYYNPTFDSPHFIRAAQVGIIKYYV
jgi:hypothetical protein